MKYGMFRAVVALGLGALACMDAAVASNYNVRSGTFVTPAAADSYYCSQPTGCTASGTRELWATNYPHELTALATALGNNADLIYEYVRNNIEVVPIYGLQKGALGAMIDRAGTPFDQAHLMVELLRASGYSASYVSGTVTLSGAQVYSWLGVSEATAAQAVLADGGIPASVSPASGPVSSVTLSHIWVRATINGTTYEFDPSFKPHTFTAGIDVAAASGWNESSFIAGAQSGMVSGTQSGRLDSDVNQTINVPYVSRVNAASVKSSLAAYANSLTSYLRSNGYATKEIDDVIGRQDIQPSAGVVRQATLPGSSAQHVWSGNIPDVYRTRLKLEMMNAPTIHLSQDLFADEVYGRRVAYYPYVTANGWVNDTAQLFIDGIPVGPIYSGTNTAVSQAGNRLHDIRISIDHPYAGASGAYMDEVVSKRTDFISPVIIAIGFGETDEALQAKLASEQVKDKLLPESSYWRCAGPNGECENPERPDQPAGETSLVQAYAGWLASQTRMTKMQTRLRNSIHQHHSSLGIATRRTSLIATNPNGYCGNCWAAGDAAMVLDIDTSISVNSKVGSATDRRALARSLSLAAHTLEASQWEERTASATPASVGHRFGWGVNNDANLRFFLVKPQGNSVDLFPFGPVPYYYTSLYSPTARYTDNGFKVIVAENEFLGPGRACNENPCTSSQEVVRLERGGAFQAFSPDGVSMANVVTDATGRSFQGGSVGSPPNFAEAYSPDKAQELLRDQFKDRSQELGVDLRTGEFSYTTDDDISVGLGDFPYRLSFNRTFRSGEAHSPGMGRGWTHNLDIRIAPSTNVGEAMGKSSALAAASTIVALYATQQIYAIDPGTDAGMLARWVVAPFVHDWWAEKIRFNVATHTQGASSKVFVRLSDGTFNPPGGYDAKDGSSFWKLTQTGVPTGYGLKWNHETVSYTLTSPSKDVQTFAHWKRRNRDFLRPYDVGQHFGWHITNWTFPAGVSLTFGYVPVDDSTWVDDHLSYVQSSLGRRINLTFTPSSAWDNCHLQSVDDNVGHTATFDCTNWTMTSPAGDVERYVYGTMSCGVFGDHSARPRCSPFITDIYGPADSSSPALRLTYDKLGRVRTYLDAVAVKTPASRNPYTFNIAGTRGERVDPAGQRYTVYYDRNDRAIQFINELGYAVSAQYDGLGRVTKRTSATGIVTEFEYDHRGNTKLLRQTPKATSPATSPASLTVSATYDPACGKVKTVTDAKNATTTWNYNAITCVLDNVQQPAVLDGKTNANAVPTTTYTYTGFGAIDTLTDPTGVVTDYDYDSAGNRTFVKVDPNAINAQTGYGYDSVGNITTVTTGRGNTTTYGYDGARRVTRITGPAATCGISENVWVGGRVQKVRNARICNPNFSTDTDWQVWNKTYTPTGQPDVNTDPDGGTLDIDYDSLDRAEYQRQSIGGGFPTRVTRTEYDAAGQALRVYKAWGTPDQVTYSTQAYDPDGRLLTLKDANQNLTNYRYDGYGRLNRLMFPDGSYETYAYDNNGNIYEKRNRSGYTIAASFDALNRQISRSIPDNPNYPGAYSRVVTTTYDLTSRKYNVASGSLGLNYRYDTAGRLNRVVDTFLNTLGSSIGNVEYGYDASSNRNAVTFYASQGAMTINYEFDAAERLWRVTQAGGVLAQYGYDEMSRMKNVAYLDATSVAYQYEADDDLQSITHTYNGGSLSLGYTHNGAHQLRTFTTSNPNYLMKQPSPALSYTPNNLNQYTQVGTAALSYDPNGNLIGDGQWSYRYDEENLLRQATNSSTTADYSYDIENRRRAKTINGVVTYFINDGQNELAELSSTGSRLRVYVAGRGVDDRVAMRDEVAGTGWQFFHTNHQGSTLLLTGASSSGGIIQSFRYGAYGKEYSTDAATGNPFRYTGRYLDAETGLYYYRARYYSAALGRFLQTDPIGTEDDVNLYAYTSNDPTNAVDPTGLYDEEFFDSADKGDAAILRQQGAIRISGAYYVGSHGNQMGAVSSPVVNGKHDWNQWASVPISSVLENYPSGSGTPIVLYSCYTAYTAYVADLSRTAGATVYAAQDLAMTRVLKPGVIEAYVVRKGSDGKPTDHRTAFVANGKGPRPFGDAITSIVHDRNTGVTTVNYQVQTGTHIRNRSESACTDPAKCKK